MGQVPSRYSDAIMDAEKELKEFERFERAHEWFEKEYFNLVTEYDEEWIAVEDRGMVIDHDKNASNLMERLRSRGLDPGKLLVGYVSEEPLVAIL